MAVRTVLVTGVGAVIGYGIINCLKRCDPQIRIVGMDIYADAYGGTLCDEFVQALPAADPHYPDFLRALMDEKGACLVFFGTEQEILRISRACRERDEEWCRRLVLNTHELIELAQDKWLTHLELKKRGFNTIPTLISGDYAEARAVLGEPFLFKPRTSYASKGLAVISCREDYEYQQRRSKGQFMVQRLVGDADHEYTAAVFGYGDGGYTGPVTLKRRLSGEGATAKAELADELGIESLIAGYCREFKPEGPTNFQFRKEGEEFYLLEINPRISSSTSLRCAFGFNEAQMCLEYYLDGRRPQMPVLQHGTAVRYIADCVRYV